MKTAISAEGDLLNPLLNPAHRAALEMGVNPSRPLSRAPEPSLRTQQHKRMTEQLNRVYAAATDPAEARTVKGMKTRFRSALKERW